MLADRIIDHGLKLLGKPYQFNAPANQTNSFDCSSFIQYIFKLNGIDLPRNSRQQYTKGVKVPIRQMEKGDLLFFTNAKRKHKSGIGKIGHVALYLGGGKMLHAFRPENKVAISDLEPEWKKKLIGIKRIVQDESVLGEGGANVMMEGETGKLMGPL